MTIISKNEVDLIGVNICGIINAKIKASGTDDNHTFKLQFRNNDWTNYCIKCGKQESVSEELKPRTIPPQDNVLLPGQPTMYEEESDCITGTKKRKFYLVCEELEGDK